MAPCKGWRNAVDFHHLPVGMHSLAPRPGSLARLTLHFNRVVAERFFTRSATLFSADWIAVRSELVAHSIKPMASAVALASDPMAKAVNRHPQATMHDPRIAWIKVPANPGCQETLPFFVFHFPFGLASEPRAVVPFLPAFKFEFGEFARDENGRPLHPVINLSSN